LPRRALQRAAPSQWATGWSSALVGPRPGGSAIWLGCTTLRSRRARSRTSPPACRRLLGGALRDGFGGGTSCALSGSPLSSMGSWRTAQRCGFASRGTTCASSCGWCMFAGCRSRRPASTLRRRSVRTSRTTARRSRDTTCRVCAK
jgi:hypothetical protein